MGNTIKNWTKGSQSNKASSNNEDENNFNQYQSYQNTNFYQNNGDGGKLRILNDNPDDKEKKTVAVIITFCNGGSYDQLFTTIKQKAIDGTKVEVYACDSLYLNSLN